MKLLSLPLFSSCRSSKDSTFTSPKPKHKPKSFSAGVNLDPPTYLWSKRNDWHPVSYQSSAAASPLAGPTAGELAACRSCAVPESMRSLAVVRRSEDPRADFRRSMAEMVVEKGMRRVSELEQLLHCFLSLNSHHHHLAIVAAFADMWEELFPAASVAEAEEEKVF